MAQTAELEKMFLVASPAAKLWRRLAVKINIRIILAVQCISIVSVMSSFGQSDFSGIWILNNSKSNFTGIPLGSPCFPPRPRYGGRLKVIDNMSIKMRDGQMSVKHYYVLSGAPHHEMEYVLDGESHVYKSPDGEVMYRATWDGYSLIITRTEPTAAPDTVQEERLTLASNKNRLTRESKLRCGGQSGVAVMVYDRR